MGIGLSVAGVKTGEIRKGRIFGGGCSGLFGWGFLEILPLHKSKDKPKQTHQKLYEKQHKN